MYRRKGVDMKLLRSGFVLAMLIGMTQAASARGLSVSFGAGVPFINQFGLHYSLSDKMTVYAGYTNLSADLGTAQAEMTLPEVGLQYHPFGGAFFLGLGAGSVSLESSAVDAVTLLKASIEVTATAAIGKMGWMWGAADGGLWFGIDLSYISPSGPKSTITAPGVSTTSQAYLDAESAADKFGTTAFPGLTFLRLGYFF
jgi:hypothetical protein